MRPDDIRAHLRKQLFEPFRVFMSDGATYDVRHLGMAAMGRTELHIGLGGSGQGDEELPDRFAYCDPVHVVRIEPIHGHDGGSPEPADSAST